MDKDEALRMALEALEKLWNIIDDIDTYGDMAKNDEKLYRSLVERRQRTRFKETGITTDGYELSGGAITAIKEALAQPEQEPVAWMYPDALCDKACLYLCTKGFTQFPECATPPQRKPLTDEEIEAIWREGAYSEGLLYEFNLFARAIEAAHGIGEQK